MAMNCDWCGIIIGPGREETKPFHHEGHVACGACFRFFERQGWQPAAHGGNREEELRKAVNCRTRERLDVAREIRDPMALARRLGVSVRTAERYLAMVAKGPRALGRTHPPAASLPSSPPSCPRPSH